MYVMFQSPSSSGSDPDYCSNTLTSQRSTLSDTMPDIAMATGAVSQLQLHDQRPPDLQSNLGPPDLRSNLGPNLRSNSGPDLHADQYNWHAGFHGAHSASVHRTFPSDLHADINDIRPDLHPDIPGAHQASGHAAVAPSADFYPDIGDEGARRHGTLYI